MQSKQIPNEAKAILWMTFAKIMSEAVLSGWSWVKKKINRKKEEENKNE
jgi:cation transport regulator ChaB